MKTKLLLMLLVIAALSISAGAVEVTIVNPGFETAELVDGDWNWMMDNEGWGYFADGVYLGSWNPESEYYGGSAPEGQNIGWTSPGDGVDGGFAQVLTKTFDSEAYYVLTVEVGNCIYYAWAGYKVQLLAGGIPQETGDGTEDTGPVTGGTILAEDDSSKTILDDDWRTSIVEYAYDPAHASLVGEPLQIRLLAKHGGGEVNFDDVRLEKLFYPLPVRNPSPSNTSIIPTSDDPTVLSWTNADPNTPGDDVFVDVWFGTDPDKFGTPSGTALLAQAQDATSVSAGVLAERRYYWRVDSYIEGSTGSDPVQGPVWFFDVIDLPIESVSAGKDMITWDGQAVQLDSTVVDDGGSALSYVWSANPDIGVVFYPNEFVEDPIVTITKPAFVSEVPIANAGFEMPSLADGYYDYLEDWPEPKGWGWFGTDWVGNWNPESDYYGGVAPEGRNIGFADGVSAGEGGFAQILTQTFEAETQYTLTVEVGDYGYYEWNGYKVQFLAGGDANALPDEITGGILLAEDANSLAPKVNTFKTSTVVYDYVPADENKVDLPLQIRLIAKEGSGEVDFDDVRLFTDPPRVPHSGVYTVLLTLAVNDENNPTVTDKMVIDVYDDACAAAIGADQAPITDIAGDGCITDLEDLALALETWLDDTTTLTAAVPLE